MSYIIFTILGYISGSILYASLIPKAICHINICEVSDDGNPGTANAYIHCGFFIGTLVLLLELGKGFLPLFIAARFLEMESFMFVPVMIAPVLGHAFPMRFTRNSAHKKGGKAIATSFGVLLGLAPIVLPVLLLAVTYIVFSLVLVINPHLYRSIVTFGVFSLLTFLLVPLPPVAVGSLIISIIVIFKHLQAYHGETLSVRLF